MSDKYHALYIDAIQERDMWQARARHWMRHALWYAMSAAAAGVIIVEAVKLAMGYCR